MTTPPSERTNKTHDFIPVEGRTIEEPTDPLHFPRMIEEEIQYSSHQRETKTSQLTPAVQVLARTFIRDHVDLETLILEARNRASSVGQKNPSKEEVAKNRQLQQEIKTKIQDLEKRYSAHGFESMFIDSVSSAFDENELEIKFFIEKSQTCFINKLAYLEEVKQFIEQEKIRILKEFYPHYLDLGIDPETITFNVELVKGETHNHGKIPAYIQFSINGNQLFKIVYKPRSAAIDWAVIHTFDRINSLNDKHKSSKSSDPILPVYKILNFDNRSLWEYIEGDDIKLEQSVGDFIRRKPENDRWLKARQTLNRMDAILTQMGISDLHKENVKVRNLAGEDVKLFPIDLENRRIGAPTQLGGRPKEVNLTSQENTAILDIFEPLAANAPCRYLPLGTQAMAGLITDYKSIDDLLGQLVDQFLSDKFLVVLQSTQLKRLLIKSVLNHDIPYFTEWHGILYYGLPGEGNMIARKEV